jgi:AmmeMemoRadiSam system protein A
MALAAAFEDTRFDPLKLDELENVEIELSVLTPMQRLHDSKQLVLGRDGIYIKKAGHSGTFLPQVATNTGWTLEEFLGHCSADKAGLGWDGWRNAELYTYQALVFAETDSV